MCPWLAQHVRGAVRGAEYNQEGVDRQLCNQEGVANQLLGCIQLHAQLHAHVAQAMDT